jgi:hypothetical protein
VLCYLVRVDNGISNQEMFIIVYTALLMLPGLAILLAVGRSPASFGEIPLSSIGLFVLSTAITGWLGWDAVALIYIYGCLILLVLVVAGWRVREKSTVSAEIKQWLYKPDRYSLLLVVCLVVFGLWAGPYTEIPADVYWHFGRITDLHQWFENRDSLEIAGLAGVFKSINYYWYRFVALSLHITGSELKDQLGVINLVNILVFGVAFFSFAKVILSEDQHLKNLSLTAAIATIFMLLHFGMGPFSYVRYYTFGPAFFALVGFFALMAIFVRVLAAGVISIRLFLGSTGLALVVAAIHLQEALYLIVMATMLVGVFFLRRGFKSSSALRGDGNKLNTTVSTTRTALGKRNWSLVSILFFSAVAIYAIAHFYMYFFVVRNWPLDGGFLQPLSDLLPFAINLFVLKPTEQFYQVLTIWGVFAYLLFFLSHRKHEVPSYISAGLWLPLFTVFNPIFIDLFLRVSFAEVVWRLCFLITVELYAAWYLVRGWQDYCQSGKSSNGHDAVGRGSYSQCARMLVVSFLLLAFLLPINSRYLKNDYSKLSMLSPVTTEASYQQFEDVLDFLNTLPPNNLLTDQVTGYVINAFTPHIYHGHKFFNLYTTITYLPEYQLNDIALYRGGYLVINARNGDLSSFDHESGGHWPADVRLYDKQYSYAFWQMVLDNPDIFTNIWQLNGIQVYQIAD